MAKIDIKAAISQKTQQSLNNSYISSEQIKQSIVVLEELRNFIPSPTDDELTQLEANIVKNGCKDALLLWETTQRVIDESSLTPEAPVYILVDGHNPVSYTHLDVYKRQDIELADAEIQLILSVGGDLRLRHTLQPI